MAARRRSFASALDAEFSYLESEDDALAESDGDLCLCGAMRREHDLEGKIEGRCRGFKEKA
jgi:hypothetical protein